MELIYTDMLYQIGNFIILCYLYKLASIYLFAIGFIWWALSFCRIYGLVAFLVKYTLIMGKFPFNGCTIIILTLFIYLEKQGVK